MTDTDVAKDSAKGAWKLQMRHGIQPEENGSRICGKGSRTGVKVQMWQRVEHRSMGA